MLGRTGVCLAGTHGKSTTTAMLGAALTDAGLDPTAIVGATCRQLDAGALAPMGQPSGFRLGRDTVPAGTKVTVQGFMAKDGALRANARDITFPDGKKMFVGSSNTGAPDERPEQ